MAKENIFLQADMYKPEKSQFDLSHKVTGSGKLGTLIPTCVMECMPGDSWQIKQSTLSRMLPLVAAPFTDINVKTAWFFVPYRIMYSGWEDFISGKVATSLPTVSGAVYSKEKLGAYLGFPPELWASHTPLAFPGAAYAMIYDEYFRHQFIHTTDKFQPLVSGNNAWVETEMSGGLYKVGWKPDYFTSANPSAQVSTPVGVPISSVDVELNDNVFVPGMIRQSANHNTMGGTSDLQTGTDSFLESNAGVDAVYDPNGTLIAEFDSTSLPVAALRTAVATQEFLERMIRGGQRYIEVVKSNFGIDVGDHRVQRPEHIGTVSQTMVISEVLSTAQTDPSGSQEYPIGYIGGHGISAGSEKELRYQCKEHGVLMAITWAAPPPIIFSRYSQVMDEVRLLGFSLAIFCTHWRARSI